MPRARNIKPGWFTDERRVELAFEHRILELGLNAIADREGRLEDRPKKIKMEVFPADDVNVEEGLWCLHRAGLILRYSVENKRYIQITEFAADQSPHKNERDSTIPAPEDSDTSTVQIALIPDSLIPDSGFLNPNPRSPDSVAGAGAAANASEPPKPDAAKARSVDEEVEIWMKALASVLGAKSPETMAKRERWREVVASLVREQWSVAELLSAAKATVDTTEPRYFSPDAVLAQMQLGRASAKPGNGNGLGPRRASGAAVGEVLVNGRRAGEFSR